MEKVELTFAMFEDFSEVRFQIQPSGRSIELLESNLTALKVFHAASREPML